MRQQRLRARKQALCRLPYGRGDTPAQRPALEIAIPEMNAAIAA